MADAARARGYTEITGPTFRDVTITGPFYESLGCVEDPEPHPIMIERRKVERAVGLDRFGTRVVKRLKLRYLVSWLMFTGTAADSESAHVESLRSSGAHTGDLRSENQFHARR